MYPFPLKTVISLASMWGFPALCSKATHGMGLKAAIFPRCLQALRPTFWESLAILPSKS